MAELYSAIHLIAFGIQGYHLAKMKIKEEGWVLEYTFGVFHGILGTVILILDIVAIVSVLGGTSSLGRKVLWVVIILVFPFIGVICYFLIGRTSQDA